MSTALHLVGKRTGRPSVVAMATGPFCLSRMETPVGSSSSTQAQKSVCTLLLDWMPVQVSLDPHSSLPMSRHMEHALCNCALPPGHTNGISRLPRCHALYWELISCVLTPDVKENRLVDATTYLSVSLGKAEASAPHLHAISSSNDKYDSLLSDYPDITSPNPKSNMVWSTSSPQTVHRCMLALVVCPQTNSLLLKLSLNTWRQWES